MTPTTEPTIDKIIDELLAEAIEKAITEWAGQEYPNDATFYDVTVKEAKQAIKALIANQVREARIDELRLIEQAQQDEDKWSLFCMDDTSDFGNYIAGRIKELGE